MVKLSRPNSLTRTGSSSGGRWKKPIELTRSSSSKRWSFRQADSVSAADSTDGGYNTDEETANTGKINKSSKDDNELKSASSAVPNRVLKKVLRKKESRKPSFDARDEEDENDFWNPFSAMFNEEDRDDDDSYYSDEDDYSAGLTTVGTDRTDDADASVGIFGMIARSVGNRLDPETNDRYSDDDDERGMLDFARSTDRDSSTDVSAVDSSWDEDDATRRDSNVDTHSYDMGEDSVANGNPAKRISSKSREVGSSHLYHFSTRVKVQDGTSEKKKSATDKSIDDSTAGAASKDWHSPSNMSRNRSFRNIIPKAMPKIAGVPALQRIRSGKKNTGTGHDETTTTGGGKSTNSREMNTTSATAHVTAASRDETVLQKMMTAARQASDSDVISRHSEKSTKKAKKKEATRLKKEIKKRDKARKSELRRIEAEEKQQLKAQEREAQIAAAQAKKAEAEAKLAAIVAEAKLKKKHDEIEREEQLREAEIAAEEAEQTRRRAEKAAQAREAAAAAAALAGTVAVGTSAAAASSRRVGRLSEKEGTNQEEEEVAAASRVRRSGSISRSLTNQISARKEKNPVNGVETKSKIGRSPSLTRPSSLFKRNKDKSAEKEEEEENESIVYSLMFKPSIEVEDENEEHTLSREMSRPSAVSKLLSQHSTSTAPVPLPVSPQHSTSGISMSTYDPTCSPQRSRASEPDGSFVRSSTYNTGDLVANEALSSPSSLKREPSPRRTVSFQRSDNICNDVIVEEVVKDIVQDNVKNMNLQTNQKVSPRTGRTKNTFCIHEYDEKGNQAVAYNEFGGDPICALKIYQYDTAPQIKRSSGDVLVKVQASTVSYSDCVIRQGNWWGSGEMKLPVTPGVDFVGKVCAVGGSAAARYGFESGDVVASLVRSGGNARFAKIDASQLVEVPDEVDASSAACMVETYLAAFQSLHLAEATQTRYDKTSLLGKSVLIIGGIAMVGQAMIELAFLAGASTVYVTARKKHHNFLRSLGAIPLPMAVNEWLPFVQGRMDLVVDAYCTDHYSTAIGALHPRGKMVCIRTKSSMLEDDPGLLWHAEAFLTKMGMSPLSQTYAYDVYESWDENIDLCKDDLIHLFELLRMGLVEPPIADCIPLAKVPQAQQIFETKRIQGFFVCEPWLKQKKKAGFC